MATLSWQDRNEGRRVILAGELDNLAYEELAPSFEKIVNESSGTVVVDMGGVTFLSSKGLDVRTLSLLASVHARRSVAAYKAGNEEFAKVLDAAGAEVRACRLEALGAPRDVVEQELRTAALLGRPQNGSTPLRFIEE